MSDVWTARPGVAPINDDLVGFDVQGRDGAIGRVDHVNYSGSCVVVAIGRFRGKKHVVPAWAIEAIDAEGKTVRVDLDREAVEGSPEYDDILGLDDDCETRVGAYYEDLAATR